MTIYVIYHDNQKIEFVNLVQAESYALQHGLSAPVSYQKNISVDYAAIVSEVIRQKQEIAPQLLRQLYAENTLAGITTAQSDQLFDEYSDIILRIREGAFPTALYRLQQKQPSGFVTQELLDKWAAIVATYL